MRRTGRRKARSPHARTTKCGRLVAWEAFRFLTSFDEEKYATHLAFTSAAACLTTPPQRLHFIMPLLPTPCPVPSTAAASAGALPLPRRLHRAPRDQRFPSNQRVPRVQCFARVQRVHTLSTKANSINAFRTS
eukprot:1626436-Pleurochrysis_carterae.AAC.1